MDSRVSGILMPIFSLPGEYGVGRLGDEARAFIDALAAAKQHVWQILPLGPTGYGNSPYSSLSTHAGNPYFINLARLMDEGLLSRDELDSLDWGADTRSVDYVKLYANNDWALRTAFDRFGDPAAEPAFLAFLAANEWVDDFTLYATIKHKYAERSWSEWPEALRHRDPAALATIREEEASELAYRAWQQWLFAAHWDEIHGYATAAGVQILGDLPIYVSYDSVDTWSNPELFDLDDDLRPLTVSGCPPDGFSETGQLWGTPIYRWAQHESTGYAWWARRLAGALTRVDLLRIDHFRGLESYYEVPAGSSDARHGVWRSGPGIGFFSAMEEQLGAMPLVLEDLGYLTPAVEKLRDATGYPGMKPLQFAFDSREGADYLPHNFTPNCVAYTGTHDNDTLRGWLRGMLPADLHRARVYLNSMEASDDDLCWAIITRAMTSVASICIVPVADYLGLGSEARINTPSTSEGNWLWRMDVGAMTPELIKRIAELTDVSERAGHDR